MKFSKFRIEKDQFKLLFKIFKIAITWLVILALTILLFSCGSKKKTFTKTSEKVSVLQQNDIQKTKTEFKKVAIIKTVLDTFEQTSIFNNYLFTPINPDLESEVHLQGNSILFKNATVNISSENITTNANTSALVREDNTEATAEDLNDKTNLSIDTDNEATNKNKEVKGGKTWLWWWLFILGVVVCIVWSNRKKILAYINPVLGFFTK